MMKTRKLRFCALLLPVLLCGCDGGGSPATAPATAPTTAPAAVGKMRLSIAGRDFIFTPAILAVSGQPPRLQARLYNTDEGGGRESDAVYLECPLDLEPDAPFTDATHHFRTENRERTDALTGIFLPGEKVKLQPLDVSLSFAAGPSSMPGAIPDAVTVNLKGQFLVFAEDADVATNLVPVSGTFQARVKRQ